MEIPEIKIEKMEVSQLKGWDKNPREIEDEEFATLKEYIKKYGIIQTLTVDGRDRTTVLGGNMRLKALKELGVKYVNCSLPIPKNDSEAVEIAIIDNAKFGKYIKEKLLDLSNEYNIGLDLKISMNEISLKDLIDDVELVQASEDNYEEPEELPNTVARGEVWQLGKHRLMCGDSTSLQDVSVLMDGKKSAMIFSDPPYGMGFDGSIGTHGEKRKKKAIVNDKTPDDDFLDGFLTMMKIFNTGAFYLTYWRLGIQTIMNALSRNGLRWRNLIIWKKNNFNLSNSDYKSIYEPILFGWDEDYEPILYGWQDEHMFKGSKGEDDVWEESTVNTIWEIDKTRKNDLHSTMKPVKLCGRAILNSSKKGDIVMDLFGGSGSTLIACEQTDRICYMMELDEHYCSVIVDRWQKLTGETAMRIEKVDGLVIN